MLKKVAGMQSVCKAITEKWRCNSGTQRCHWDDNQVRATAPPLCDEIGPLGGRDLARLLRHDLARQMTYQKSRWLRWVVVCLSPWPRRGRPHGTLARDM
jgi:hypothetical protein